MSHDSLYARWTGEVFASIGVTPTGDPASLIAGILGSYFNPGPVASGLRLTLNADGSLLLEKWLDLGGKWCTLFKGFFLLNESVLHSNVRDIAFCDTSFAQDGLLHVRRVGGRTVLVPRDSINDLDRLLADPPDWIDRLDETFFGLNLFFETHLASMVELRDSPR